MYKHIEIYNEAIAAYNEEGKYFKESVSLDDNIINQKKTIHLFF